jgi:hypothetical protein
MASIIKSTKNMSHEAVPKMPVEAIWVGKNPTPKGKSAAQKGVVLTSAGLYMSQSCPKVLGPEPSRATSESTALEIFKVAENDGRTSVFSTLKV